jgi:hypothetical protein
MVWSCLLLPVHEYLLRFLYVYSLPTILTSPHHYFFLRDQFKHQLLLSRQYPYTIFASEPQF